MAAALCWCQFVSNIPCPVAAGLLAWFHSHDAVPAGGFLHLGGFHPDDCLGQGEAPQLPEGVPRLPSPPLAHPAVHLVEDYSAARSTILLSLAVGVQEP